VASHLIRYLSTSIYNYPFSLTLVRQTFGEYKARSYKIWLDLVRSSLSIYSISNLGKAYARSIIKLTLF